MKQDFGGKFANMLNFFYFIPNIAFFAWLHK